MMSTTTADQLHELGARWVAAEIAGDTDTLGETELVFLRQLP